MYWKQTKYSTGGQFYCQVKVRALVARRRAVFRAAGQCVHCGGSELVSATMCGPCLDAHREAVARHDEKPYRQLRRQLNGIASRARARAAEGFEPTTDGQALLMAEFSKGSP